MKRAHGIKVLCKQIDIIHIMLTYTGKRIVLKKTAWGKLDSHMKNNNTKISYRHQKNSKELNINN